jgi:signal peptidase I
VSRRFRPGAGAALMVVLFGLWFVALRPASLGGSMTYLVVRGDSMEPTYRSGDLVVLRTAARYAVGDIVGYRVPAGEIGAGHLVIHRIAGGDADLGYAMQGDNNPSIDPWMPRPTDIAGVAWIALPAAGRLLVVVHQPVVAGALAVALLMGFLVLRWPAVSAPGRATARNPAR